MAEFNAADPDIEAGMNIEEVCKLSGIDPWFLVQIEDIIKTENALKTISIEKSSIAKRVLVTGSLYLIGHFLEKNK